MTRILSAAFIASTAVLLAGCPSGTGALIPGATGVGGSAAPTTGASSAPTTGGCTRTVPADAARGTAAHGAYNNQLLPAGWAVQLKSEAEVYEAIKKQDGGADWDCFKVFYPGATTLYQQGKGK